MTSDYVWREERCSETRRCGRMWAHTWGSVRRTRRAHRADAPHPAGDATVVSPTPQLLPPEGDGVVSMTIAAVQICGFQIGAGGYNFFFFFQAEDGIRDLIVTGVQTCALPI